MKEEEEEEEEEGFEEWGADFLEQLIQVEEHALSSQLPSSISPPSTTTTKLSYLPPPLQPPQQQQQQHQDYQNNSISYSPPRELSQRPIEFGINYNNSMTFDGFSNEFTHSAPSTSVSNDNARDLEIDRLKVSFFFFRNFLFIRSFLWIHICFLYQIPIFDVVKRYFTFWYLIVFFFFNSTFGERWMWCHVFLKGKRIEISDSVLIDFTNCRENWAAYQSTLQIW